MSAPSTREAQCYFSSTHQSSGQALRDSGVSVVVASTQQERQQGRVYVTGRHVGGFCPVHTAIEYTDVKGNVTVLSAGPREGLLYSEVDADGFGNDSPADNFTVDVVNTPKDVSAS